MTSMYYIKKQNAKKRQHTTETGPAGRIAQISLCAPKYTVELKLGGRPVWMEVDTGAVASVASEEMYKCGCKGILWREQQFSFEITMEFSWRLKA